MRPRGASTVLPFVPGLNNNRDPFNGTRVTFGDHFATRNQFYGGQGGIDGRWQCGRFSIDGRATLAPQQPDDDAGAIAAPADATAQPDCAGRGVASHQGPGRRARAHVGDG